MPDCSVQIRWGEGEQLMGSIDNFFRQGEMVVLTQQEGEERMRRITYDITKYSSANLYNVPGTDDSFLLCPGYKDTKSAVQAFHTFAPLKTGEILEILKERSRVSGCVATQCRFLIVSRDSLVSVALNINGAWRYEFYDQYQFASLLNLGSSSTYIHNVFLKDHHLVDRVPESEVMGLVQWDWPLLFPMDDVWEPDFTPANVELSVPLPILPSSTKVVGLRGREVDIEVPMRDYFAGPSSIMLLKAHARRR